MEKFYNVNEVAEMFGVTLSCIRKWILDKTIGHYKIGKNVRISESQIREFIKKVDKKHE